MNAEVKKAWVAALRSGEYKQGTYCLSYTDGESQRRYCCLGVLCDIALKQNAATEIEWSDAFLPESVQKWAGLGESPVAGRHFLTTENDFNEKPFTEIADLIEKYL